MNPAVKTTHVIPKCLPPVRLGELSTFLVCRYCLATIGAYSSPAQRLRLEKKHLCSEKMTLAKPAASVPFN